MSMGGENNIGEPKMGNILYKFFSIAPCKVKALNLFAYFLYYAVASFLNIFLSIVIALLSR